MTKSDLIQRIAQSTQRTKTEAEEAIDIVLGGIGDALANGDKVDLRGFGSFQISEKGARTGRNPRTGEPITIAARKVAVFKPGRELADRVNALAAPVAESGIVDNTGLAQPSAGPAKVHGDKIT